jgi:hypothetical protein
LAVAAGIQLNKNIKMVADGSLFLNRLGYNKLINCTIFLLKNVFANFEISIDIN